MLSFNLFADLYSINKIFEIGAIEPCGEVAGLVVKELLPLRWNGTAAKRGLDKMVHVIEGALMAFDEHGSPILTVPKGGSFFVSRKKNHWLGLVNPSRSERTRFAEIEFEPRPVSVTAFEIGRLDQRRGVSRLIASPTGYDGSITLGRDVSIYSASLRDRDIVTHQVKSPRRAVWIFVASGCIEVDGQTLPQFFPNYGIITGPMELACANWPPDRPIELIGHSDDAEVFLIDSWLSEEGHAQAA